MATKKKESTKETTVDPVETSGAKQRPSKPRKQRIRQADLNYDFDPDGVSIPREGTERRAALALLLRPDGATVLEVGQVYADAAQAKGKEITDVRRRGIDCIRSLSRENGYGFVQLEGESARATFAE